MYPMPRKSRAKSGLSRAEILENARNNLKRKLNPGEKAAPIHIRAKEAVWNWLDQLEPKERQAFLEAAYELAKPRPRP